ncbi:hypothetical protein GCM10010464_10140 [Pseudonocardia yunnanensis]
MRDWDADIDLGNVRRSSPRRPCYPSNPVPVAPRYTGPDRPPTHAAPTATPRSRRSRGGLRDAPCNYLVCAEYEDLPTPRHDYRVGPVSSRAVRAGAPVAGHEPKPVSIQTAFAEARVPFPWSTRVKSGVDHGGDANGAGLRLASS